jgi:hypothetical protein
MDMHFRSDEFRWHGPDPRGRLLELGGYLPDSRGLTMKQARKYHGTEQYLPSNFIGAASELQCAADLLRRGVHVFRSLTPCSGSDLVMDLAGELLRVEVRSAKRNGSGQLTYPRPAEVRYDVLALVEPDGRVTYQPDPFTSTAGGA